MPTGLRPEIGSILHRSWETLFLQVLVAGITYFLISETAQFYASTEGGSAEPLLKAILLESGVLALSLIRARSRISFALQRILLVVIYLFCIWGALGILLHRGIHQRNNALLYGKVISELEVEVAHQTALRTSLFNANRISKGWKVDQVLIGLKEKLDQNRKLLVNTPDGIVIWHTVFTLVMFRILIMATQFFCLQELKRRYRWQKRAID